MMMMIMRLFLREKGVGHCLWMNAMCLAGHSEPRIGFGVKRKIWDQRGNHDTGRDRTTSNRLND